MMPAPPNEHLLCTSFLWPTTAAFDIEITRLHRRPLLHTCHCIKSSSVLDQASIKSSLARLSRIWVASAPASALSRQAEAEVDLGKIQEEQPMIFALRQRFVMISLHCHCFSSLSRGRPYQEPISTQYAQCLEEPGPMVAMTPLRAVFEPWATVKSG